MISYPSLFALPLQLNSIFLTHHNRLGLLFHARRKDVLLTTPIHISHDMSRELVLAPMRIDRLQGVGAAVCAGLCALAGGVAALGEVALDLAEPALEERAEGRDGAEDNDEPELCAGPGQEGDELPGEVFGVLEALDVVRADDGGGRGAGSELDVGLSGLSIGKLTGYRLP